MSIKSLLILLTVCLFAFAAACFNGCAATGKMTTPQKIAAAKIIARDAGFYVAKNNPELAQQIVLGWGTIAKMEGIAFQEMFFSRLQWYLDKEGVAGSKRLIADARDLLALFGYDLDSTVIDMGFIQRFDVGNIKAVVGAFVDGAFVDGLDVV